MMINQSYPARIIPTILALVLLALLHVSTVEAGEKNASDAAGFDVAFWIDHQDFATPAGGRTWDTVSPKGLEEIIDYCRESGATTLYWRGFGGGLTVHNSKLEEGLYPQLFDKRRTTDPLEFNGGVRYGNCTPDIMRAVVEICHRKGMKCLVYWPWEDTHNIQCFNSRFTLEHPGLWDERRDGYASPARLSLAYEQTRRYKLGLAKEFLDLGVDGFFIDYRRQSNWSPEFGYVRPALAAYRKQYGRGPDPSSEAWLRFRAAYQTRMLEELRELCNGQGRPLEIIAAPPIVTPNPIDQLRDNFVDWPSWVALGLIDGLAPDGLPYDAKRPMQSIEENMNRVRGMIGGRAKLYWSIRSAYDWGSGLRTIGKLTGQSTEKALDWVLKMAWENGAEGVQIDTFDPGCESAEWIAILRKRTQGAFRTVNANPRPAAKEKPVEANYTRPPELEAVEIVVPDALEDRVKPRRLTDGKADDGEPRFSPDGKTIVFQRVVGDGAAHICTVGAHGGKAKRLTKAAVHDLFPSFSPDGKTIAFASDRAEGRYYHIYLMPASGGEAKAITAGKATDTLPCFTPDGKNIVFTSTRGTDFYTHSNVLYQVPVAGGEPQTMGVLKYAQIQPTVSGDGRWMAFTALDAYEKVNFYACIAPFGRPEERVRLTSPTECCHGASISPDGRAVAYSSPGPDRQRGWDVWIRDTQSDRVYRVTNSAANDRAPSWSPGGRKLVFQSNRGGAYGIYTIDVSGLKFSGGKKIEPWDQELKPMSGWIDGDSDPENTPLVWGETVRPAMDYKNRSFGRHLGRCRKVKSVTVVNDMPRGECRIDAAHAELYHGDANGKFRRYRGPLSFSKSKTGGAVRIKLGDLDLETTIIKVRFAYPDTDYTAVCSNSAKAVRVELAERRAEESGTRVWTTLQGKNRLLEWVPTLGEWTGSGHELSATATPESDLYSGEGGRVWLPQKICGDFDFYCQFQMPDNSTGAGGPVVYFRGQEDGSLYAFRYVNYWGTGVLQKKLPDGPWKQIGYSTGRNLSIGRWHDLRISARGPVFSVTVDGSKLVEGSDAGLGDGMIGLGCQVRPVRYRSIRIDAKSAEATRNVPPSNNPKPYRVVCGDAGHGGYQAFPGLCRVKNGDLLAVFYAGWTHVSRPGKGSRKNGGAIAMCRSSDNGRTWGPPQTVLDTPLDDRDPAIWQCDDGTLVVSSATVDWAKYKPPHTDWCYAYTVRSSDNGRTWSKPEELKIGEKRYWTVWTEPRRLKNGEWLWPMYRNWGSKLTAAFMRSTDGGLSWGEPRLIHKTHTKTDEPDICQFPDGSLFCAMRPESGSQMWQSRSTDNGHSWTPPTALPFHGHCANLLYTRGGITLLAVRDVGMQIHYSFDRAKTWAGSVTIDCCGGAYSQMVELPDGRILIVYYTEGKRAEIRAQVLRVSRSGVEAVGGE